MYPCNGDLMKNEKKGDVLKEKSEEKMRENDTCVDGKRRETKRELTKSD